MQRQLRVSKIRTDMDTLISLLKGAAPMLATAVAGPMGGAAISMLASKFGSHLSQLVVPILALGTVTSTFIFIASLLFLEIKTDQQQLVIFALGYATAAAQQVLSYYFGSSKSSQDKTLAMQGKK